MRLCDVDRSSTVLLSAPAGPMEVVFDLPAGKPVGLALVAHPQPLLGGHALHKVPHVLARALADAGWWTARPNFRGVGRSAGQHDEGSGEAEDLLWLAQEMRSAFPGLKLALIGFSFGAFVQARVARTLADHGEPAWRVVLAGMPFGEVGGGRRYDTPRGLAGALVVHGEHDERVPLAAVLEWAAPDTQPVVVVPGADHFFSGRLPVLRGLVMRHLSLTQA